MARMYYFVYCTFLNEPEMRIYLPDAEVICKAKAKNHRVSFNAAGKRENRGWCHLDDTPTGYGHDAYGLVVEHDEKWYSADYEDFERCWLTVYGDDGKTYECWTYRLIDPGIPMRPPHYYWHHIPVGLKQWNFPQEYVDKIMKTFEDAAECPDFMRPKPAGGPGNSADSR